jgi:hypothetical protein
MTIQIPRGTLVRSNVVSDPGAVLSTVLDREMTGYVLLEPHDAVLLGAETRGVITFEEGVPVLAYEAESDTGGAAALGALAVPGPYSADLFELPSAELTAAHDVGALQIPPPMPADRLAGDPDLAARTRETAPADRVDDPAGGDDPVAAFLADEETIAAIRQQARDEARQRAAEWGLDDHLDNTAASESDGSETQI